MRKKIRRILLIITLTVLLIFLGIIVYLTFSAKKIKNIIEDELAYQLELNCEIRGDIQVRIIPGITLKIFDIHFDNGDEEILRGEQVNINIPFSFLYDDIVEIKQLELIGPSLRVWYDEGGRSNWDLIGFDEDSDMPDTNELNYFINLNEIRLEQGYLLLCDKVYGDTLELENVFLNSDSMTFTGTDDGVNWDVSRFIGRIQADNFRFNAFNFKNMAFNVLGAKREVNIYYHSKDIYGGSDEGSLKIDHRKSPMAFHYTHKIHGFRIQELMQALEIDTLFKGTMDFTTELSFNTGNGGNIFETMNGYVHLGGDDLILHGYDIDDFLKKLEKSQHFSLVDVGALFVAGPVGPLVTKGYDFVRLLKPVEGDSSLIPGFKSDWTIMDGKAIAEDVCLSTTKNRLAVQGEIDVAHSTFNDFEIAILNEYGCAKVSQTINGSFADPESKGMSKVGALLGPVKNFFKGIFKKKKNCPRFYEGSVTHPVKQ